MTKYSYLNVPHTGIYCVKCIYFRLGSTCINNCALMQYGFPNTPVDKFRKLVNLVQEEVCE